MYSPKYVDYLDEKCIESAFYNPKSKRGTFYQKSWFPGLDTGYDATGEGGSYRNNGLRIVAKTILEKTRRAYSSDMYVLMLAKTTSGRATHD